MSTSQGSTGEPRRSRGRPRTPGAEQRIIDAALEEYGEHGWSGFTMDGVARRAGVGKSTVYLRWQDKDALLTDAVSASSGDLGEVDTGSLREDLRALGEFDLVVNATSATRGGDGAAPQPFPSLPMSLAGRRTAAVDLSYGEAAVGFLAWARAAGVRDAIDGLGMLVEQAAESFRIWHGLRPDTDPVHGALRDRDAVLVSAD